MAGWGDEEETEEEEKEQEVTRQLLPVNTALIIDIIITFKLYWSAVIK